jgi:hypothetical protein
LDKINTEGSIMRRLEFEVLTQERYDEGRDYRYSDARAGDVVAAAPRSKFSSEELWRGRCAEGRIDLPYDGWFFDNNFVVVVKDRKGEE